MFLKSALAKRQENKPIFICPTVMQCNVLLIKDNIFYYVYYCIMYLICLYIIIEIYQ